MSINILIFQNQETSNSLNNLPISNYLLRVFGLLW